MIKGRVLSFLIPIVVVVLCLWIKSDFTNISNSIIVSDMGRQYVGFLNDYRDILINNSSIFYSFSNGLGGMSLLNYYYYLGSPLNSILLMFNRNNLVIGILIIILLKIGLSGLTMNIYLKNKFKLSDKMVLLFSMCYGLMSYNVNLYFSIMWLDAVYLLPLVALGIDRIVKKKSVNAYVLFLSLTIIINYYIGFMVCIFSLLYFTFSIIVEETKNKKEKIICFFVGSILSAFISSFVLIPVIFNLQNNHRPVDYMSIISIKESLQTFPMFLTYLFPFTFNATRIDGSYNIHEYCGLLVLLLIVIYFFNKKISKKNKICVAIFLLIFILSICFPRINFIWHGFSYPIGFHFRWSFCISFFMIVVAAYSYQNLFIKNKLPIVLTVLAIIIVVLMFNKLYPNYIFVISIVIILFLFYLLYLRNMKTSKKVETLLLIIGIVELSYNCCNNIVTSSMYNTGFNQKYSDEINNCITDSDFYRDSVGVNYFVNLPLMCGIHAASYTSSNINESIKDFFQLTGSYASSSRYSFNNSNTNLMKDLLGIKYIQGDDSLYVNKNALSLGYMVAGKEVKKMGINPFENQNRLISSLLGKRINIMKKERLLKKDNNEFVYYIDSDYKVYFAIYQDLTDYVYGYNLVDIYVNDKYYTTFGSNGVVLGIVNIGTNHNDENVQFKMVRKKDLKKVNDQNYNLDNLYVYYEDEERLKNAISILKQQQLKVTKMEKNVLEGHIDVKKSNQYLFLSIPYEKGWNIYVDGKKVKYEKTYDAFIGIKLKKGHHEIKMKFYPYGFKLGCIVSGISIIVFILCCIFKKRKKVIEK